MLRNSEVGTMLHIQKSRTNLYPRSVHEAIITADNRGCLNSSMPSLEAVSVYRSNAMAETQLALTE